MAGYLSLDISIIICIYEYRKRIFKMNTAQKLITDIFEHAKLKTDSSIAESIYDVGMVNDIGSKKNLTANIFEHAEKVSKDLSKNYFRRPLKLSEFECTEYFNMNLYFDKLKESMG